MCCAGRSAPSQCEMVTGLGFSSPNQPHQERTTAYHDISGSNSQPHAHCATIVGDWEEPTGESRLKPLLPILFVLLGSGAAVAMFGGQLAFGGVIAIVGTVAVLLERYLNR